MNVLLRESRAIVTDIPGTTRDTIEESLDVRGIPVVLTDTAGIRETEDRVESIGIERSQKSFEQADLVIWMLDGSEPLSEEDHYIRERIDPARTLILLNKSDLPRQISTDEIRGWFDTPVEVLETSMQGEDSLQGIEDSIEQRVEQGMGPGSSALITNTRHKGLLEAADASLADACRAVQAGEPLELIEIDVNEGYRRVGEIIGEETAEDILDTVFERFCLGK